MGDPSHIVTSSPPVTQGPRCSLRTQRQYSDAVVDITRVSLLYVPGIVIGSILVYVLDKALGLGAFAALIRESNARAVSAPPCCPPLGRPHSSFLAPGAGTSNSRSALPQIPQRWSRTPTSLLRGTSSPSGVLRSRPWRSSRTASRTLAFRTSRFSRRARVHSPGRSPGLFRRHSARPAARLPAASRRRARRLPNLTCLRAPRPGRLCRRPAQTAAPRTWLSSGTSSA